MTNTTCKRTLVDRPYCYLIMHKDESERFIGVVEPVNSTNYSTDNKWEACYYSHEGRYSLGFFKQLRDAQEAIEHQYETGKVGI